MKKTLIIGLLVIAVLLISGCVSTTPTPTPQPTATPTSTVTATTNATMRNIVSVDIINFRFVPANVTVTRGTIVTWTNDDTVPHTVKSVTNVFDPGNIDRGKTYNYTFNQAGSFEYNCSIHATMPHGIITVT
jgi:plastocyanin